MLLRKEFTVHENGFYFLYVTDSIRVETPHHIPTSLPYGWEYEITVEDKLYYIKSIRMPILKYSKLDSDEAAYFQESTVTNHLDDIISASKELLHTLEKEFNYVGTH